MRKTITILAVMLVLMFGLLFLPTHVPEKASTSGFLTDNRDAVALSPFLNMAFQPEESKTLDAWNKSCGEVIDKASESIVKIKSRDKGNVGLGILWAPVNVVVTVAKEVEKEGSVEAVFKNGASFGIRLKGTDAQTGLSFWELKDQMPAIDMGETPQTGRILLLVTWQPSLDMQGFAFSNVSANISGKGLAFYAPSEAKEVWLLNAQGKLVGVKKSQEAGVSFAIEGQQIRQAFQRALQSKKESNR